MSASSPHPSNEPEPLSHEIRDEASRLAHHPIEELRRLEHVAADGESATTPLLATIGVGLVIGVIFAIVLTATLLVYYYA